MSIHAADVIGHDGMVASTHALASRAGRDILLAGGNAVDAAVATALALCVVQPSSNGIAGYGGGMVVYLADERRVVGLDYNCRAPKAAREDMYGLDDGAGIYSEFPSVACQANYWGPMAVSVPATVAGLHLAEKTYGRLGWSRVIEPALLLAADGFTVREEFLRHTKGFAEKADIVSLAAILPEGRLPQLGETWLMPDLAKLLEMLAAAPDSFYRGEIARRIVDRVQSAGGILTEEDMADYRCEFAESRTLDYKGIRLHANAGVTGSTCTLQTMAILQQLGAEQYGASDPGYWGDLAGALTLAWRDRLAHVGDVPGIEETVSRLISDEYTAELATIVRERRVWDGQGDCDPLKETVHLSTCDRDRNMVSLTQTHGGGWGTRFAIPGLGLVIGHGMSRFDPRPGLPNSPGSWKKPLHNMSPLILTRGDELLGSVGLPGGRTIPSVVSNLIASVVDFGYTPSSAVCAPRIHTEGGVVTYTGDLPAAALEDIQGRGHEMRQVEAVGGSVSVILVEGDRIIGSAQAGEDAALGL